MAAAERPRMIESAIDNIFVSFKNLLKGKMKEATQVRHDVHGAGNMCSCRLAVMSSLVCWVWIQAQ